MDLGQEAAFGDSLRGVRDIEVATGAETGTLRDVPGHELGRARGDRRAQDERCSSTQRREELIERGADIADVDLDVRERGRADGDDDVLRRAGIGEPIGECEIALRVHAVEKLLRPRFLEGHPAGADGREPPAVLVHADHAQPVIGEGERERQADASETDDRDVAAPVHLVHI